VKVNQLGYYLNKIKRREGCSWTAGVQELAKAALFSISLKKMMLANMLSESP
jgi:hypothetical protein